MLQNKCCRDKNACCTPTYCALTLTLTPRSRSSQLLLVNHLHKHLKISPLEKTKPLKKHKEVNPLANPGSLKNQLEEPIRRSQKYVFHQKTGHPKINGSQIRTRLRTKLRTMLAKGPLRIRELNSSRHPKIGLVLQSQRHLNLTPRLPDRSKFHSTSKYVCQ